LDAHQAIFWNKLFLALEFLHWPRSYTWLRPICRSEHCDHERPYQRLAERCSCYTLRYINAGSKCRTPERPYRDPARLHGRPRTARCRAYPHWLWHMAVSCMALACCCAVQFISRRSFWSLGPNWPSSGEIDIVEGVSDYTVNQASIHTASGCSLPTSNMASLGVQGPYLAGSTDCNPYTTGGSGCGIRDVDTKSFGPGFNNNGGGVYAMIWVNEGIQVWFFSRQTIPADIQAGAPNPGLWSQSHLKAFWPSTNCNIQQFFKQHQLIFDTTLCGDWAANVWNSSGVTGQEQSCGARTGFPTCESYVLAQGGSFSNAYWQVNYVKVFQDLTDSSMSHS